MTNSNNRSATHSIHPMFLDRWSPRAFTGEAMDRATLMTIIEAGHWAPSAFNYQPWRFVYALKGDKHFDALLGTLIEFNQGWAKNASALIFVISDTLSRPADGSAPKLSRSHSFDAGAAWGYMALQAIHSGYHAHAMTGVDFDKAAAVMGVPSEYKIEAAIAVGKMGDKSILPEGLQAKETPNSRKPLSDVASEGTFKA
ncbi:nitroreductase family protein [Allorhizobium sp. BGMRC 0089]|uniref:nitroreductase family protein n=1 Tax=Allorhizobium sonneratiae TaxID=2934936 RepID=UPI00203425EE|nr:nitroreductase family protein [Allorhizobium sonneratiae]MCM2294412.1 nitroreductase family protein [Allorhizobium sonneratiae]